MNDPVSRLAAALADRYRIERELGAGGMATVYLAQDLKHGRKVAIKVLKPELAAVIGAERFVVEIKTTASLQHPHILPLFDSGTADSFLYYVMPFIDGETLRSKLDRETQLGIDESVRIAVAVADALDYAHRHGVVHRDIKPENILLHDGRPMVADFGIALALSAAAGGRMTETGLSLGTPHYMSPEQATAEKEITARSDVYSLGSVLYEMLTGNPPHTGASAQQIIMKIVTEDAAPVTKLRKAVPRNVAAAVAQSLEKLPADRFETARAFGGALQNPGFTVARTAPGAGVAASPRSRLIWPVALLAVAALGAWGWFHSSPLPPQPVARLTIVPSHGGTIGGEGGRMMAISRDGSQVVYSGKAGDSASSPRMLFLRRIGDQETRAIPGTERARYPFFSPDGLWVGFVRGDTVKRVLAVGGPVETIFASDAPLNYAFWGDDGSVVLGINGEVATVPAFGGELTRVPLPDSVRVSRPEFLPGSRAILASQRFRGTIRILLIDRSTGAVTVLVEDGTHPQYLPTGHLAFGRLTGGIFVIPFDARRGTVSGSARPMLDDVLVMSGGASQFAVADNGTAVYLTGTDERVSDIVLVDLDSTERIIGPRGIYRGSPRFSPDGGQVVGTRMGENLAFNLFVIDAGRAISSRRTFGADDVNSIWSPDGAFLTFSRFGGTPDSSGLYQIRADGSGSARVLIQDTSAVPGGWSPDGQSLLYRRTAPGGTTLELMILSLAGDSVEIRPYLQEPWRLAAPALSPDGHWAAYISDESGSFEVFVRSFPVPGAKFQISPNGGFAPRWSADGRSLFYRRQSDSSAVAADLDLTASVRVAGLRDFAGLLRGQSLAYDVHPNGRQFVTLRFGDLTRRELTVVLNWFTAIRERMGGTQ